MAVRPRPLILVRGFGFFHVEDERANPYQGFNEGTVYPDRRGEDHIYEGFLLRALKSQQYQYTDATNVIAYYNRDVLPASTTASGDLSGRIILDPNVASMRLSGGVAGTIWVYRYYDLLPRSIRSYAQGLVRLLEMIEEEGLKYPGPDVTAWRGVDIIAHSMGGLIVNEALRILRAQKADVTKKINKIVTLGTPHRGIRFQAVPPGFLSALSHTYEQARLSDRDAMDELAAFDFDNKTYLDVEKNFDIKRLLTVVGTNFRTYHNRAAVQANALSNIFDGGGIGGNHSDGLVMQQAAQLPNAPRAFVHKCHGGNDSLVTARETYEIAMRFLHGTHYVALRLESAEVLHGGDLAGSNEFFLGVSIKPRGVDFNLTHQSMEAQNCYGPFDHSGLDEENDLETALRQPLTDWSYRIPYWAGPGRLIWEGWIDAENLWGGESNGAVFRLDLFVGEDDPGSFSDKIILRKQVYVQVFPGLPLRLFVHTSEKYLTSALYPDVSAVAAVCDDAQSGVTPTVQEAQVCDGSAEGRPGWDFYVRGSDFTAVLHLEIEEQVDPERVQIKPSPVLTESNPGEEGQDS